MSKTFASHLDLNQQLGFSRTQNISNKSINTGIGAKWQKSKSCHICNKNFTAIRRRHHCRWCGQSCCQQHSSKQRPYIENSTDLERICDACDMEIIEGEIRQQIEEEVTVLYQKQVQLNQQHIQLLQQQSEWKQLVVKMEEQLEREANEQDEKERNLKQQLEQATEKTKQAKFKQQQLRKEVENAYSQDKQINNEIKSSEVEVQKMDQELEKVRKKNQEMESEINFLQSNLQETIPKERVKNLACRQCYTKIARYLD